MQGQVCNLGTAPGPDFEPVQPFFPRKQPQGKSAWSCAAAWTNQVRKVLQHLGIGSILNEQCLHDAWKLPQTGIFSKCCCFFSRLALLKSEVAVIAIFPLCH